LRKKFSSYLYALPFLRYCGLRVINNGSILTDPRRHSCKIPYPSISQKIVNIQISPKYQDWNHQSKFTKMFFTNLQNLNNVSNKNIKKMSNILAHPGYANFRTQLGALTVVKIDGLNCVIDQELVLSLTPFFRWTFFYI